MASSQRQKEKKKKSIASQNIFNEPISIIIGYVNYIISRYNIKTDKDKILNFIIRLLWIGTRRYNITGFPYFFFFFMCIGITNLKKSKLLFVGCRRITQKKNKERKKKKARKVVIL